MTDTPVEYIPFMQTVAPLFRVVQATAIVETRAWHARQTAQWAAHTSAGAEPGYKRFGATITLPGSSGLLSSMERAHQPEETRGAVVKGSV